MSRSEIKVRGHSSGEEGWKTSHFAHLMDLCHMKNVELANTSRNTRSELCSGRDNVIDEEGYRAVFTEQRDSAAPRAATKFLDTCFKASWCGWRAVSAYTRSKITEAHSLLRLPKDGCLRIWIRFPPRQRPKSRDKIQDSVVPLERNLHGHPLAGLLWERNVE